MSWRANCLGWRRSARASRGGGRGRRGCGCAWASTRRWAHVDRALPCGGGARGGSLDRPLALEMEIPVAVGSPLDGILLGRRLDADAVDRIAPQLVPAGGRALRGGGVRK